MATTFAETVTHRIIRDFLSGSGIHTKDSIAEAEGRALPGFEKYIVPHKLLQEERACKRGTLVPMATKKYPQEFSIDKFSMDYLESILVLEHPRTLVPRELPFESVSTKSAKRPRTSKAAAGPPAQQAVAKENGLFAAAMASSVPAVSLASSSAKERTAAAATAPPVAAPPKKTLPRNFYEVVVPFFDKEFFQVEIDDFVVSQIFFVKITAQNYRDFLLTSPDHACNFTNINERLRCKKYTSVDEFLRDFKQLFHNTLQTFEPSHLAVKEAMVFKEKFDRMWPLIESQFRW